MEIRLLGEVQVRAGDRRVRVGPPQRQVLLAALAADAGRPVPVDVLIDRAWGENPPPSVRSAIHTNVTHLRRLLGAAATADTVVAKTDATADDADTKADDRASTAAGTGAESDGAESDGGGHGAGNRLVLEPGGYVLQVHPDAVDLLRFRQLAAQARHTERSDPERVELLDQALALWRGVPLAGHGGEWAARMRETWRLERLGAVLEWARAALRLGQTARVIPASRQLAEEYPTNEALAVVQGWALAAEGRRDEAVEHCSAVVHRLRSELGTDPGRELASLQRAVLADQPLPPLSGPPSPPAAPVVVPAQLPGDVPGFAGRGDHLSWLDGLLTGTADGEPTAVVISAVSGTAGVGKPNPGS